MAEGEVGVGWAYETRVVHCCDAARERISHNAPPRDAMGVVRGGVHRPRGDDERGRGVVDCVEHRWFGFYEFSQLGSAGRSAQRTNR